MDHDDFYCSCAGRGRERGGNTISAAASKQLLFLERSVFEQIVIGTGYIVKLSVNE